MLCTWRRSVAALQSNHASLLLPLLNGALLQPINGPNAFTAFPPQTNQFPPNNTLPFCPPSATVARSLFSLPGFENEAAKRYTERRLIGFSPQQMYGVVADVKNYYQFVPWCQKSTVLSRRGDTYLEAELEVGFQVFVER
jgi:hypothetical protein